MTPNDVVALDRIRRSITVLGFAPTVRELADEIGVGISGAHAVIGRLVEAGKLRRTSGRVRAIDLPDQPDLRVVDSEALKAELARRGEATGALSIQAPLAYGRRAVSCAADCCQTQVRRGHLFCRDHWFMLPRDLRDDLLRAHSLASATRAADDAVRYQELVADARDRIDTGRRL